MNSFERHVIWLEVDLLLHHNEKRRELASHGVQDRVPSLLGETETERYHEDTAKKKKLLMCLHRPVADSIRMKVCTCSRWQADNNVDGQ